MQIKTIEQILRRVYSPDVSYDDMVEQAITQDRADIRAVLREGVKKTVCASEAWEGSYDPMEYQNGYARAKKDILTLIDTLLPGDVSK